jgi:hypothetical protein
MPSLGQALRSSEKRGRGQSMGIAQDVFTAVAKHLGGKSEQIETIAATGYSFEEWVNWEAYLACKGVADWVVLPRPGYRGHGIATSDLGDLYVRSDSRELFVEVAVVHDQTGAKWLEKIDWDREKLSRLGSIGRLQLVIGVSTRGPVTGSDVWERWFQQTVLFQSGAPEHRLDVGLREKGQLVIFGWSTEPF